MRIGANVIENYGRGIDRACKTYADELSKALSEIDTSDATLFIDEAIRITQHFCDLSAESTAMASALFYDMLREMQIGEKLGANPFTARNIEATEKAIRSVSKGESDQELIAKVLGRCIERVELEGKRAAGETVVQNAMRDPAKPKFARVPSGVEACEFCMMLASRGFMYASRKAAGESDHYHPNCRCRIVPSFGKTEIEGYDPQEYLDKWKHPEKYPELREARNARRRELYAESKGARELAER